MSKVVKFGGSSLADAKQFRKVADIIHADPERKYVVPSAPGKRFKEDTKVTDMLYRCYDEVAVQGKDFTEAFAPIRERYNGIISDLGLTLNLDEEFAKIGENFKAAVGSDYAASRGEYLNGIVLANYLGFEFIDVRPPAAPPQALEKRRHPRLLRRNARRHHQDVLPRRF